MSVSRGKFLKSLGSSVTGFALGSGIGAAAQALAQRIDPAPTPVPPPPEKPEEEIRFIESGPEEGHRVALTFDDGPNPGVTDRILDELQQRGLQATFFMIGQRVVAAPDLARRVLAEGHEVGNHSYTHPKLSAMAAAQVESELQKTQDTFRELLSYQAKWFRPPFGAFRKNQAKLAQAQGLGIVFWNVDPSDWSQPGEEKIVDTVLALAGPGSIIVCHDMHRQTAACVGRILDGLLAGGLQPVTLSVLLGESPTP